MDYAVPLAYHNYGLDNKVLKFFNLIIAPSKLDKWYDIIERLKQSHSKVRIAVIAKYHKLKDAYKSVIEALDHAGIYHKCKVELVWLNAESINCENISRKLLGVDGILVPGGFGERATEGKIAAINYARINNIPFFGICLGMQLAAVEIARNLIGIKDAVMEKFKLDGTKIIKRLYHNQENLSDSKITLENSKKTMRLGSYVCNLVPDTVVANIYGELKINERHRHRYKFNNDFQDIFEKNGVMFSGFSEDKEIIEAIELPNLLWFVGVQFHPEFKSKPFEAHPLFIEFIKAAINYKKNVNFT